MVSAAKSGRQVKGRHGQLVLLVAVLTCLWLGACTRQPTDPDLRNGPVVTPAGAVIQRDLEYGPTSDQRLDVYAPSGARAAPILVMVHGGGWSRGDKASAGVVKKKVAHYLPAGYLVVSTNYRLSPAVDPLTEAQDVATAMAFVQTHAADWGGDPSRIVLMGHSAGAHLVSLVTADPSYRDRAGATLWLGTVALDSAAYDVPQIMAMDPHLALYDDAFGHDVELQRAASPTLVTSGTPAPVLLVCGSNRVEACQQAEDFAAAVRSHGSTATVLPMDLSHGDINSQVGLPGELTSRVDHFLRSLGLPT
jgi:acetyl esterase/lipase